MISNDKTYLLLSILITFSVFVLCAGQNFHRVTQFETEEEKDLDKRVKVIWCTISRPELKKCNNFAMANERDRIRVGYDFFKIECIQAFNKDECMALLDQEKATLTTLDAGEIFIGGRFHSLVPISQEVLEGGFRHYYSVAVVKKETLGHIRSLYDLRGTKACFAGVETFAGWVLPINTLMKEGGMEIADCNNHVKSAINFFGPSCAVNSLSDKFNPIGDNSDKLCQLCIGKIPGGRCSDSDPYAGYEGAFRCLLEAGDIAFVKHTTVKELTEGVEFVGISKDSFELFCKDGTRRPIEDYLSCNWGEVPADAVVTTSASLFDKRKKLQLFLEKAAELYPKNSNASGNNLPPNIYGNNNYDDQPEFDQFGNRIYPQDNQPQYDQYGNRIYDQNQPDFNPYTNSPQQKRKKRQNFGDFGRNDESVYANDHDQNRNRHDQNNNGNDYNPYRDQNSFNDRNRDRNRDPNNPYADDKFGRDPYNLNKNQYGVNIDPYAQDPVYNRENDPLFNGTDFNRDHPYRNNTYYEVFSLFESSPRYGIHGNLMFQDNARGLASVSESLQTYTAFLGKAVDVIMGVRQCQVNRITLCVTSDAEKDKCVKMRTALKAQLLKPEMDCYKGHSQIHCMQAIRAGTADVTVLDASDVYTAGLNYDLVPFISEVYNLEDPEYYVVAVAKESDPSTELTYLRGKNTCHGGINTAAGWIYPLAFLLSNGWIRPYGCNSIRAAAEYFSKSCVPGALSTEYNTGVPYDNMCDLCHGASFRYCRRDASEDYYGHTGAFRCLVEGGGHVAFVKHTTVIENTGGKKREWWARDNLNDDFELLCTDGTRAEIDEYRKCNLGKVKANAIVTRGGYGYNETHISAYINLFMYAQTFYGRKTTDEFSFSMFYSQPPYSDLIFQDATTQLKVILPSQRYYSTYLGPDFMRARRIVDCHAGAASNSLSLLTLVLTTFIALFILKE